jgi:hypothetical protein
LKCLQLQLQLPSPLRGLNGRRSTVSPSKGMKLKTRIKRSISFSNVVALLALFFALGGTVYAAGQISGTQIKAKSIPGNRIKPKSLTGTQIKPGSLTGAQIKSGSLSDKQVVGSSLKGVSASSLATVQYVPVTVSITPESQVGTRALASCPVGMKVIGGGASVSNDTFGFVNDNGPTPERLGWSATGFANEPGVTITVTAICTPVTTSVG